MLLLLVSLMCSLCSSTAAEDTFSALLSPIPGSGSQVRGRVTIAVSPDGTVTGIGSAEGLEPGLSAKGGDCTAKNACGVHIHSGESCADTASQGGHLYSGDSDPWLDVLYPETTPAGEARFGFGVDTGRGDVEGKPFIVHSKDGGRVACGLLIRSTASSQKRRMFSALLSPIPGSGSQARGRVTIGVSPDGTVTGIGSAKGLEPGLSAKGGDCTAKNACGVHIHSGESCADTASQGGHLYSGDSDPWLDVLYPETTPAGEARFGFGVDTGRGDVEGKPFIVHSKDGGRVACGLLIPVRIDSDGLSPTWMINFGTGLMVLALLVVPRFAPPRWSSILSAALLISAMLVFWHAADLLGLHASTLEKVDLRRILRGA